MLHRLLISVSLNKNDRIEIRSEKYVSGKTHIVNCVHHSVIVLVGSIDLADLNLENSYKITRALKAYSQSKLANILFTKELARRLKCEEMRYFHRKRIKTAKNLISRSRLKFFLIRPS